jgi:hypothetical protein
LPKITNLAYTDVDLDDYAFVAVAINDTLSDFSAHKLKIPWASLPARSERATLKLSRRAQNFSMQVYSNSSGYYNTASAVRKLCIITMARITQRAGIFALCNNITGSSNIALGYLAGQRRATGDSNIDIGNPGVAYESSTIRLGTVGTHSAAFIAGISGVIHKAS